MIDLKNKKILMLVESPNKVHKIKEIMKTLGYNNVIIMATVGHTTTIADNRNSYKNTGIWPEENFRVNTKIAEDKKKIVDEIKQAAKSVDIVLIASDPDREGENLGNHIKDLLKLKEDQYYRVMYHSITVDAIKEALEHPCKMDYNLIAAAEARQILDKIVGYSLSPLAKTYLGCRSVGRCQSAGLKLIADREREIEAFKPENYYNLYLNFEKNGTKFSAKYIGTDAKKVEKITSKDEIKAIKYQCSGDYVVKEIIKKERQESPKPPFCTATLQQEAANKLGLTVKDVMSIAQKLFETGTISYHRSDSTEFAPEFIDILKPYIEQTYGKFVSPRVGKKLENDQNGHECIRVTDPSLTPELFAKRRVNDFQLKLYTLIWQRTIASVLPNARISETVYNIYNNNQKFNLISNEVIDPGYRSVYSFNDSQDEAFVKEIFAKNEILQNCVLEEVLKTTTPPSRFTEASLVKELQNREIGRPSTLSSIVETVLSEFRGYASLVDKKIVPTEKGMQLSAFLDRAFSSIISLTYTKEMEASLDKIAEGKLNKIDFLTEFYNNLEKAIKDNKETAENIEVQKEVKVCPKCGAPMAVKRSRFGKLFYGCTNYPSCNGLLNID